MNKKQLHCIFRIAPLLFSVLAFQTMDAQHFFHKESSYLQPTYIQKGDLIPATPPGPTVNVFQVTHDTWFTHDPTHANPSIGHEKIKDLKTTISFSVDHIQQANLQQFNSQRVYRPYVYRVYYRLRGFTNPGDLNQFTDNLDTLTIGYDPDSNRAYQDKHMKIYYGYHKVELQVIDIFDFTCTYPDPNYPNPDCPLSPASAAPAPILSSVNNFASMADNWNIEVRITSQKFMKDLAIGPSWLAAYGQGSEPQMGNIPPVLPGTPGSTNYLTVFWSVHPGNQQAIALPALYELEWTYADDYKVSFSSTSTLVNVATPGIVSDPHYNFRNNSTRIVTDKSTYKIPLIYKRGYVVYRVRMIRPDQDAFKTPIYTDWSLQQEEGSIINDLSAGDHYYKISDYGVHQIDRFNWNFQSSYAEEGKSKQVVSYFDGMLRNRQTITKFNSLPGQQIVAETFYNFEGKPGLQTLPIPIEQNELKFVVNFATTASSNVPYAPGHFDNKFIPSFAVAPYVQGLNTSSPASKYYSSGNPFYNTAQWSFLKYLPDAEGYPFIQTKYAAEDGRVVVQGGAGKELQIGKGHETRMFYLSPEQNELNRYFGKNIGKATFYEKTITRDPNNQVSFSVTNNKGLMVMSGLMGSPEHTPANLPSYPLLLPDQAPSAAETLPQSDLLYGIDPLWIGAQREFSKAVYAEVPGTINLTNSLSIPYYSPCTGANLNVGFNYNISLFNGTGTPIPFTGGTAAGALGSTIVNTNATPPAPLAGPNINLTANVPEGKTLVDYKVSYDPKEVEAAVKNILYPVPPSQPTMPPWVSPYPACLKDEGDFLRDELDRIEMFCDKVEEGGTQCYEYEELLKSELFPTMKYGKYTTDRQGRIVGQNLGLYEIIGWYIPSTNDLDPNFTYSAPTDWFAYDTPPGMPLNARPLYRYQNLLLQIAQAENNMQAYLPLLQMSAKEFIEKFDKNAAEKLLKSHPEYCAWKKIYCDASNFEQNLESLTYDDAVLAGMNTLAGIVANDPFHAIDAANLTGLQLVRFYNRETGAFQEEPLDRFAYISKFCNGDKKCRDEALIDPNFYAGRIALLPGEKQVEFFKEMVRLYIANRQTRISKYEKTATCNSSFVLPFTVWPKVIHSKDDIYTQPNNTDYPIVVEPQNDPVGTAGVNASVAMYNNNNFNLNSTPLNPTEGYNEYANEIVQDLANCRNSSGNFDAAMQSSFASALVAYMMQHGGENIWKGGLTPAALLSIMNQQGLVSDDLCNPYLVDYLKRDNVFKYKNNGCMAQEVYDEIKAFFNRAAPYYAIKTTLAAASVSANQSAVATFNCDPVPSSNIFEKKLLKKLYPNLAPGTSASITILVRYYNALTGGKKGFTVYFYDGQTVFSEDRAVALHISSQFNVFNSNIWEELQVHADLAPHNAGCCTQSSSEYIPEKKPYDIPAFIASVTCTGNAAPDEFTFYGEFQHAPAANGYTGLIVCQPPCPTAYTLPNISIEKYFTGSLKGLQWEPDIEEQDRCITCLELKQAYTAFQSQVMTPYSIKGYGHPFFEDATRSFFNYYFKKNHSSTKYLEFMEGCNLAEQFYIPRYYSYLSAATGVNNVPVDPDLTDAIDDYFKNDPYGSFGQAFKNYNNLYYLKSNSNNIVERSHIYVDFNYFPKNSLRKIKDELISYLGSLSYPTSVMKFNYLADELSTTVDMAFADLYVHDMTGAATWNPANSNPPTAIPPSNMNWYPYISPALSNDVIFAVEPIHFKINGQVIAGRHFTFKYNHVTNGPYGPVVSPISLADRSRWLYTYNTSVIPDVSRGFVNHTRSVTHLNSDNLEARKRDYLDYVYSQEPNYSSVNLQEDLNSKKQLISVIQPGALRASLNTPNYSTNYGSLYYLSYFNPDKAADGDDLFLQVTNNNSGLNDVSGILTFAASSLFPMTATTLPGNYNSSEQITVKYIGNNTFWYHSRNTSTKMHRNLWLRLPRHVFIEASTLAQYSLTPGSVKIAPTGENIRRFSVTLHHSQGADVTIYGKTDFDLQSINNFVKVFEDVMLCDDYYDYDTISTCYEQQLANAYDNAASLYERYLDSTNKAWVSEFHEHIRTSIDDKLKVSLPQSKYYLTLYGYDRAGNLMYTVPPDGVTPITGYAKTDEYRENPLSFQPPLGATPAGANYQHLSSVTPQHAKVSSYYYNSLNQIFSQSTPDGGKTNFYYDKAGRLIFSQNAKQEVAKKYTYTLYDGQNRVVETGEVYGGTSMIPYVNDLKNMTYTYSHDDFKNAIKSKLREDVIHTFYDQEMIDLSTKTGMSRQENMRSRVATVARYKKLYSTTTAGAGYSIAIYYSYDLSGNVKTLTYDMPILEDVMQRYKRVDYDYDLYSGKVRLMSYNRSFADQFYQRYEYDDDNRITKTETSKDGMIWDEDAQYTYYPHGPLARIAIGDLQVQGIDFAYTLQGWLKSINGDTPNPTKDMGGDSYANPYLKDMLQASLYYFKGDYKPIDPSDQVPSSGNKLLMVPDLDQGGAVQSLYNGNIPATLVKPGYFPALYTNYKYDQLNRIRNADYLLPDYSVATGATLKSFGDAAFNGQVIGNVGVGDLYKSEYHYDKDGNITSLKRNALKAQSPYSYQSGSVYQMDDLTYYYQNQGLSTRNNKLYNYKDNANHAASTSFNNDIQHYIGTTQQPVLTTHRLEYDEIGNLKKDSDPQNHLDGIFWNVYGKVKEIDMGGGDLLSFNYDPGNNRLMKSMHQGSTRKKKNEYYIRDASGNILAVYKQLQRYHVVNPWLEVVQHAMASTTFGEDVADVASAYGGFSSALVEDITDQNVGFAEDLASNYEAGFYLSRNVTIREMLLNNTPELIDDILAADPGIILQPLTSSFPEAFFMPLMMEEAEDQQRVFIRQLIDADDMESANLIFNAMGLGYPANDVDHFTEEFSVYMNDHGANEVLEVLRSGLTENYLVPALSRLLGIYKYRTIEYSDWNFGTCDNYLKHLLATTPASEGLMWYYNDYRSDAEELMEGAGVGLDMKLSTIYNDDPGAFIELYQGEPGADEVFAGALDASEGLTPLSFIIHLKTLKPGEATYATLPMSEVLDYNRFFLAEHHMYGSSRLGLKTYWPTQYKFEWDASKTLQENQTLLNQSQFNYRRPWYSFAYNSLINTTSLSPYGNGNTMPLYAERVIGQKRYELTNHLGNVMAVITDKITQAPQDGPSAILPALSWQRPSLFAAYDYYPFGMLMPERYVEDQNVQCTPITRPYTVKVQQNRWTVEFELESDLNLFDASEGTNVSLKTSDEGEGSLYVSSEEAEVAQVSISYGQGVAEGKQISFHTRVLSNERDEVRIRLMQQDLTTSEWQVMGEVHARSLEDVQLEGTAINSSPVKAVFMTMHGAEAKDFSILMTQFVTVDQVQGSYVWMDCNQDEVYEKDYRFGFNGQEKVNEISGIGNHNTALFWEYDTRLGRRWNLDPKPQISISDYAAFGNNPILNTDVLGDKFRNWNVFSADKVFSWNGYASDAKYFADRTNMKMFNSTVIQLNNSNQMFAKVYSQLYHSQTTYNVEQQYKWNATYSRENKTIGINYRGVGRDAAIEKSAVFEEFFHAGQDDFYSKRGMSRSNLAAEVEAKAADLLNGFKDDAVKNPNDYSAIKSYFQTGKKSKGFDAQVDKLIDEVYESYAEGNPEWAKQNGKETVDKKTIFSYLESLSKDQQKKTTTK